jgi:carbonic anhydrase/acetyltransferase-like protein (isoleucine patch superfamily)
MLYTFDGKSPVVGRDTYVSETAVVIGDVRIGNCCYVGHGAIVRGDYGTIIIGDGTAVEEGVIVHAPPQGRCVIGKRVTLGHGAIIHAAVVGDAATIGMGAVVSIRAMVGSRAIVAEGAVVKRGQTVPDSVVVAGNPARVVRKVSPEDEANGDWAQQLYIDLAAKYLKIGMQKFLPE